MAGLVLLARAGLDQWGTGLGTARAQSTLRAQLDRRGFPVRPVPGGAVGYIRIPAIALNMAFVQGVGPDALAKGPGHYPATPLPGSAGNVALAGHRTTHLAPFWALDSLRPGDEVQIRTRAGFFVYRVRWLRVVDPDAWWVTGPTSVPSLTLTTCWPRFRATRRLVVRAVQVFGPSPGGFIDRRAPSLGAFAGAAATASG